MNKIDVRNRWTVSVDCRGLAGVDETTLLPPGTVATAVLPPGHNEVPIGEIRAIVGGTEVNIVSEETKREGIVELSLDMLSAVACSEDYRRQLCQWLTTPTGRNVVGSC